MKGTVLKSTGSNYTVRLENAEIAECVLRGKMRLGDLKVTNPVAVGDFVEVETDDVSGQRVICKVEERNNYIIRKSPKHRNARHVLAANLDQAALVCTVVKPRTAPGFIDRFILSAEAYHIPVILIFNKQDVLTKEKDQIKQESLIELYEGLGYPCYKISAKDPATIAEVQKALENKTTLLSGHSGSGKSTLANALLPELGIATREISNFSQKGTHTTSFAEMHELGKDSWLIDSPGIKELGILNVEPSELSHYFVEMRDELEACKFHNCKHISEPGCRIIEMLESGEIAETRYLSYLSMVDDAESTMSY